jgi:hypothetical protein
MSHFGGVVIHISTKLSTMGRPSKKWKKVLTPDAPEELRDITHAMNAQQLALFGQWVTNGRNISKAARDVGYAESYARNIFSKNPAFVAARKLLKETLTEEDKEWIDMIPQAKRTLLSLLEAEDEKVRYLAAKDIVDRGEGKAISRITHTVKDERPTMSEGEMQLAFSLMKERGMPFAEAQEFIRNNPHRVAQWIAENVPNHLHVPEVAAVMIEGPRGVDSDEFYSTEEEDEDLEEEFV